MSDISTANLDSKDDSPRLARSELLETVNRVNALTRVIDTSVQNLVGIETNLFVAGNAGISANLQVQGTLTLGNGGAAGQVLTSQGPGLPLTYTTLVPGDKFKGSSTTSFAIDATTPKNIVVDTGLSLSAGQSIVVANDASHYCSGVVQSYNAQTGALVFSNDTQVGTGTFAAWTVNVNGGKGNPGTNGTNGPMWYNGNAAPAVGLGANNDYYVNNTNGNYYQKQAGAWVQLGNLTGPAGAAGSKWYIGAGAPNDAAGLNGDNYLNNVNGDYYQKATGTWGSPQGNLTGPAGGGSGGGGTTTVFGTTNRYLALASAGFSVSVVASSTFKTGISWARTGTSMVITDNGHGRSVGERAILRNTNVSGFDSLITAVSANTYTVTCTDTGATNGAAAAYSMGFTYAHIGAVGAITGGTLTAPANWDCVLVSMRIHLQANSRSGTGYNITLPKGNFNGVGAHTGADDSVVPQLAVRNDAAALTAIGATMSYNTAVAGDYATYGLSGVGAVTAGIHILLNF